MTESYPSRAPDTLLILGAVALLVAALVAFVAPGKFGELARAEGSRQVTVALDSYERTGDPQAVPIFAKGGGLGLLDLPFEGLVAGDKFGSAVGIVAFLLVLGGSFGVLMRTGAIDRTLGAFVVRYGDRVHILVPGLFVLFSLGGAIFGMGEESIPFVLLLVPVFARLGLNVINVVLCTYVATQVGFATSWMNPFSVIVAQGIAGLSPVSGAGFRVAVWASFTVLFAMLALRHALRTRRPALTLGGRADIGLARATHADSGVLAVLFLTMAWVI